MSSQAASSRPATALRTAGGTAVGAAQAVAHPVSAARLHTNISY